jgi:signal transduction histidine kinase
MGAVVLLAAYLAWFAFDLLQFRLREAGAQFEASTRRVEDYWIAHDAAREATLALRRQFAEARPASAAADPAPRPHPDLADAARRLEQTATSLQGAVAGMGALSQAQPWDAAVRALVTDLRQAQSAGLAGASALARAPARTQEVLDDLVRLGQQVRQRQALPAPLVAEVDGIRRQALLAFSLLVAMLVLAAALATQWGLVARRERAVRRRAEQLAELAEAERARAEAVARDKARFLGMLSHELLTPLQSIWSTMDVIESRGRVDVRDAAFTRLKDSTRTLRGRISDLVDFAKMSAGRLETRIRGFQLDKLIDTALRDAEEALVAKNLDVHWEAGPELSRRIWSDPARLRQVVDNLLSNAIKYTERGGISIHASLAADGGSLRLEIADTGVGIEPARLDRLFEPFYRAPETAAMAEGSGLGLAVVRSLVDLMGGRIRVSSQPGQGTSVVVEVPIADGGETTAEGPLHLDARRPVLVVDDSRDARRAIADVIRAMGLDVFEAEGGEAGLAEAAQRDYQAIILDMQMPDLTGYEVARRLREPGNRHHRTFLVLVSAYNDLDEASARGVFDARIDKPASRKDLTSVLGLAAAAHA